MKQTKEIMLVDWLDAGFPKHIPDNCTTIPERDRVIIDEVIMGKESVIDYLHQLPILFFYLWNA